MAKIITAYVHDLLQQVDKGEISFSRMVELINEKANEPANKQNDCNHVIGANGNSGICITCGKKVCVVINNDLCEKRES